MIQKFFHTFKKLDRFEIPISFRHKKEDVYTTWAGGVITLIIFIFAIIFCIIYLVPFIKKENYSLYYYTINLNKTEEINLKKSKSTVAFAFECKVNETSMEPKIEELLVLKVNYTYYEKGQKQNISIGFHECNDEDFYYDNNLISSLNKNRSNLIQCLNDLSQDIKYRYQDQKDNFTYYQINVEFKEKENYQYVNKYIVDKDCKVELYYVDVKIEVDDYEKPIKPFFNEVFLQLIPDMDSRMNAYFMNSYFESNNDLFFETKSSQELNNLFSRTEQYFLHREEEDILAKIYIRADTKQMIIKRTYQTLTEFFAVTFSFWEDLFIICNFIFNIYNRFALNYSLINTLFFFKEKENKCFNIAKNSEKIKRLIEKTNKFKDIKILPEKEIQNIQNPEKEVNEPTQYKGGKIPVNSNDTENEGPNENNNNNINTKIEKMEIKQTFNRFVLFPKALRDFVNLFECKCCNCKCMDDKTMIYSKAEDVINAKLDILYYLKSILSLDILQSMLIKNKDEILPFLCMPVISSEESYNNQCYKKFDDDDFEKFFMKTSEMADEPALNENGKKILTFINAKLNEIDN